MNIALIKSNIINDTIIYNFRKLSILYNPRSNQSTTGLNFLFFQSNCRLITFGSIR
jgi:hypothetical protein